MSKELEALERIYTDTKDFDTNSYLFIKSDTFEDLIADYLD